MTEDYSVNSFTHDLLPKIEDEARSGRSKVNMIDPRLETLGTLAFKSTIAHPPRVKLLLHKKVKDSSRATAAEKDYLQSFQGCIDQSTDEADYDEENVVRIRWGDVVQDYVDQANSVFGAVDKKAFFDWRSADDERESANATSGLTSAELNKYKAARKRERMVEGLKEKWYSFLLLDALRFAVDGEGLGISPESRASSTNQKYFHAIGTFSAVYDGAKPFFVEREMFTPYAYATYDKNPLAPYRVLESMPQNLIRSLLDVNPRGPSAPYGEEPEVPSSHEFDPILAAEGVSLSSDTHAAAAPSSSLANAEGVQVPAEGEQEVVDMMASEAAPVPVAASPRGSASAQQTKAQLRKQAAATLYEPDDDNAQLCQPLSDRMKERSFNQHLALQMSIWNVYVLHVKQFIRKRIAAGLPLFSEYPALELDISDFEGLQWSSYTNFRDSRVWDYRMEAMYASAQAATSKSGRAKASPAHVVSDEEYDLRKSHIRMYQMSNLYVETDRWLRKLFDMTGYRVVKYAKGDFGGAPVAVSRSTVRANTRQARDVPLPDPNYTWGLTHDSSAPFQLACDVRICVQMILTHTLNIFKEELYEEVSAHCQEIPHVTTAFRERTVGFGGSDMDLQSTFVPSPMKFATHYNFEVQEVLRMHKDGRMPHLSPIPAWQKQAKYCGLGLRVMTYPPSLAHPPGDSLLPVVGKKKTKVQAMRQFTHTDPNMQRDLRSAMDSINGTPNDVKLCLGASAPVNTMNHSGVKYCHTSAESMENRVAFLHFHIARLSLQKQTGSSAHLHRYAASTIKHPLRSLEIASKYPKSSIEKKTAVPAVQHKPVTAAKPSVAAPAGVKDKVYIVGTNTTTPVPTEAALSSLSSSASAKASATTGVANYGMPPPAPPQKHPAIKEETVVLENTLTEKIKPLRSEVLARAERKQKVADIKLMRQHDAAAAAIQRLRAMLVEKERMAKPVKEKFGHEYSHSSIPGLASKRDRGETLYDGTPVDEDKANLLRDMCALFARFGVTVKDGITPYAAIEEIEPFIFGDATARQAQDRKWAQLSAMTDDDNDDDAASFIGGPLSREELDDDDDALGLHAGGASVIDEEKGGDHDDARLSTEVDSPNKGKSIAQPVVDEREEVSSEASHAACYYYKHDLTPAEILSAKHHHVEGRRKRRLNQGLECPGLFLLSKYTKLDEVIRALPEPVRAAKPCKHLADYVEDPEMLRKALSVAFHTIATRFGLQEFYDSKADTSCLPQRLRSLSRLMDITQQGKSNPWLSFPTGDKKSGTSPTAQTRRSPGRRKSQSLDPKEGTSSLADERTLDAVSSWSDLLAVVLRQAVSSLCVEVKTRKADIGRSLADEQPMQSLERAGDTAKPHTHADEKTEVMMTSLRNIGVVGKDTAASVLTRNGPFSSEDVQAIASKASQAIHTLTATGAGRDASHGATAAATSDELGQEARSKAAPADEANSEEEAETLFQSFGPTAAAGRRSASIYVRSRAARAGSSGYYDEEHQGRDGSGSGSDGGVDRNVGTGRGKGKGKGKDIAARPAPYIPPLSNNREGLDALWPPSISPLGPMNRLLFQLIAQETDIDTDASQATTLIDQRSQMRKSAVEKFLGNGDFLLDNENRLRYACEVAIIQAHCLFVRHPHSLSSPVDLLRVFDRFQEERDRIWSCSCHTRAFYKARGIPEGTEFVCRRNEWERYLWNQVQEDLPALLAFYNALLFTRDLLMPESRNVQHAMYITSMATDGQITEYTKSRRGAASPQCLMRQLLVWRVFGHKIQHWANWIMTDDDPIHRFSLNQLQLKSVQDDVDFFYPSDDSEEEEYEVRDYVSMPPHVQGVGPYGYSSLHVDGNVGAILGSERGEYALMPEDLALNDHVHHFYNLTHDEESFYMDRRDALKKATQIALARSGGLGITSEAPLLTEGSRIAYEPLVTQVPVIRSTLRYIFRGKPRVNYVFSKIPWTSVLRYFYTIFNSYCELAVAASSKAVRAKVDAQRELDEAVEKMRVYDEQVSAADSPEAKKKVGAPPILPRVIQALEAKLRVATENAPPNRMYGAIYFDIADQMLTIDDNSSNILDTPTSHFIKARALVMDALVCLATGRVPKTQKDTFNHHREFQVACWVAATGKFVKQSHQSSKGKSLKDLVIYQRSLTNSKLVSLGVVAPRNEKKARQKYGDVNWDAKRGHDPRELGQNFPRGESNTSRSKALDDPEAIHPSDIIQVGKCAAEVDYIRAPWRNFNHLRDSCPISSANPNFDAVLPKGAVEEKVIDKVYRAFEIQLADYALLSPHQDTSLIKGLKNGEIDLPALITKGVNKVLLSTDVSIVSRRRLSATGQYILRQPLQRSNQSTSQRGSSKKGSGGGGGNKAGDAGTGRGNRARGESKASGGVYRDDHGNRVNLYEKQYRGNSRGKKSTDRDPNAVWLTKRSDKDEKGQEYSEMINAILPHHPDGEEDEDDKRADSAHQLAQTSLTAADVLTAANDPTGIPTNPSMTSLSALEVQESALKAAARHFNLGNIEASDEAKAQAAAALRSIKGQKMREKKIKEKEARLGGNFQALIPEATVQGSKSGAVPGGGALAADVPGAQDSIPVYSHLVSKPGAYSDPTEDDKATFRAFRFARQAMDEPNDSDLDLESARDMAYRKRKLVGAAASALSDLMRAKAKKAKANAKIVSEGGVLPDNADDDDSSVEESTSEKFGDAAMEVEVDTGSFSHLLVQGQLSPSAIESAQEEDPSESMDDESDGTENKE